MPGDINIGGSVFKREARDTDEVLRKLSRDGWNTVSRFGDRMTHLEKSGINITVVSGPAGTIIMPSGPVRGRIFGSEVGLFSKSSSIGLGKKKSGDSKNPKDTVQNRSTDSFI